VGLLFAPHRFLDAAVDGRISGKVPLYLDACIYVTGILYGSYFVSCNRSDLYETRNDAFSPCTPLQCSAISL
jgi:hypothetical protein